jgi:hypothetical protein
MSVISMHFLPVFIMFSQTAITAPTYMRLPYASLKISNHCLRAISGPILVGQGAQQSYTIDKGAGRCLKASKSCQPTAIPE